MSNIKKQEKYQLNDLFDELWPLFRSITGPGIIKSYEIISSYMPLTIEKISCGTNVFDWTVPPEWHVKRGRLWGPDGKLICDTEVNNLHLVNYSVPVEGYYSLEQLMPHLHSIKHLPDAIPYVTSYYNQTWGFCISENTKNSLISGEYKVVIETKFVRDGYLYYGFSKLPGESDKEILLTSYLCHPSMANNELSGPLVLVALYHRIKSWPKRRFSYRFLLNPETIGAICYLHNHFSELKNHMEAGIVLTCLGGPIKNLYYKKSKAGNSVLDMTIQSNSKENEKWLTEEFTPLHGSDERQYCSPGFNLPMGRISRSLGHTENYHNSLDNKTFMDLEQVIRSVDQIENILKLAEISGKPVNQSPYGEPQLGKRNLYPNINSYKTTGTSFDGATERQQLNAILTILSMSDGYTYMKDIADKCGSTVEELQPVIERLENENLIKFNADPLK